MKVIVIAAMAANRTIGIKNALPWKLSADLKRFKTLTTGHTIVMGRKTFESLGRPLPGRRHICVSRSYPKNKIEADPRWPDQVFWSGDLQFALEEIRTTETNPDDACFIIGGAEIYAQALPLADELELTHIHAQFEGDAWFPWFENLFEKVDQSDDVENGLKYSFVRYRSTRPTSVMVRKSKPSDAHFLVSSQIEMALESEGLHLNAEKVEAGVTTVLADPSKGTYFIAEIPSHPQNISIGCLLVQKEWSDWRNGEFFWIHSLYVDPQYRKKGICQWMLNVVHAQAKSQSALGLRLYVDKRNLKAQSLYSNFGMSSGHYDLFEVEFQI